MSDLTELVDCKDGVTSHLSTVSRVKDEHYELILARTGLFDLKYEICVKLVNLHSSSAYFKIAKFWLRRKRSCHCPVHTGAMKVLTGRDVVTNEMLK